MKYSFFTLLYFSLIFHSFSQGFPEKKIESQIQEVTLFLNGAQVFEKAQTSIPAGESIIIIKGLSPYLEEKSIQVKAFGNLTIQAVNKRMDFLSEKDQSETVQKLQAEINKLDISMQQDALRLEVLKEKISLLDANKNLRGNQGGPTAAEFRQALELYDTELMKIKTEQMNLDQKRAEKRVQIRQLENQIRSIQESKQESKSEIRVRVKAPSAGNAQLEFNYLVANAGWYPKYDVRVKNVNSPMAINYKAEVYQNTGVDWNQVKLRFSNGNPNQRGVAPQIDRWDLNYARLTVFQPRNTQPFNGTISGVVVSASDGQPIPGVSVLVKGSTVGTSTDLDGRYSLTIPPRAGSLLFSFVGFQSQEVPITNKSTINVSLIEEMMALEEVVVAGYQASQKKEMTGNSIKIRGNSTLSASPLQTTFQENQTTVEITVNEPYTIKTNGERTLVDLKNYDIPATYQYKVIPKLDKDVFLIAQLADWSQYSFLEGESNLYFEDGFVGRSILNAGALEDTLAISMGRDRSIVVQREKVESFTKKRTIGSNVTESRGYEITLRNNKSQAISIEVKDQIPVSVNSNISVSAIELSGGKLDSDTGIITWQITVPPGSQQKLGFQYEVKYPKNEKVILD
ncbi:MULTISPECIES: mucoidy inhibitor MuiA family protein [unclassified Algoriphagus]|jgi:hypothetical protein|uniref:mucoidy inhibitor MuiA family protein n=3 Tax=Algoriphagus TaxID=246875 RepID=UPI000E9835FF|nr:MULTISPECIES: mucoidy inhibitor MuiA family protein [unclassified Algoriphagus]HAS57500.1 hypothetical protein [Algoriphagus sp.]|tara:strand:- start:3495 stop:5372 length:1878 start_codon:yes stop_codon:yes gene_type:complete